MRLAQPAHLIAGESDTQPTALGRGIKTKPNVPAPSATQSQRVPETILEKRVDGQHRSHSRVASQYSLVWFRAIEWATAFGYSVQSSSSSSTATSSSIGSRPTTSN